MKYILLSILFVFSSNIIKAQDTLTMRSGENILVKVIEVGTAEVKYKKLDNLNGPIFSVLKSDLLILKYENGTKDDFSSIKKNEENNFSAIDTSFQGKNDAIRYYNGYKTAGTIALISNLFPFVPIIPSLVFSIATTSKMPSDENLNYPNTSMMKIEKYANSYRAEAMKIKKRKIWINFAAGAGFIGLALLGSMAAHIG
ncbi:MAG: hypothetical protein EBZ95_12510 [Chitinophagia bacterium]|jgi:hypothetical protein|nr:hypothetical protein [Chitinophagia bacterium]